MQIDEVKNIIRLVQSKQNTTLAYELYESQYANLERKNRIKIENLFTSKIENCEIFCRFLYEFKGLNSVYAFLKRHKIKYDIRIYDFGYHTSKKAVKEKEEFLSEGILHFHLYSEAIKCKNGFKINKIRGRKIIIEK